MSDFPARELAVPEPGRASAESFVAQNLGHLVEGPMVGSAAFRGGQTAADAALAGFDVAGYATRRNEVYPEQRRGASQLSPYIRHGLLPLPDVWVATSDGPSKDVQKFHDELLWQEFARHWYAQLGRSTAHGIRRTLRAVAVPDAEVFDRSMACIGATVSELETDGWLVNQTRMWLASHWSIRQGQAWQDGEDMFFKHLLDGSRAANRLGWQWTTGVGSSKHYGFSRWQVNKRAPGLCDTCIHRAACPIEGWPDDPEFGAAEQTRTAKADLDPTSLSGPLQPVRLTEPELVWLTAESLTHNDAALVAHPDLPAAFVFDEPLLTRLRLSAKRLIFLTETLAELAKKRNLTLLLGDPVQALSGRLVSVTFAPVPGFRSRSDAIGPAEVHPWPWLRRPTNAAVASFSAWRRSGSL